ncbi:hypothetical protein ACX27_08215 [Nostoc piscinale CENA21]|uniref:Uncharacterized protein n=1 Tax=Nostoc piscinale CENA21 TaxID=224013 RepID=A0A0M4SW32_9NOSO|nr:hypothetical protein ACX27_08215 [Nostoc piscinale CENA21]
MKTENLLVNQARANNSNMWAVKINISENKKLIILVANFVTLWGFNYHLIKPSKIKLYTRER